MDLLFKPNIIKYFYIGRFFFNISLYLLLTEVFQLLTKKCLIYFKGFIILLLVFGLKILVSGWDSPFFPSRRTQFVP